MTSIGEQIIHRFVATLNERDFDGFEPLFVDDYQQHQALATNAGSPAAKHGVRTYYQDRITAFPATGTYGRSCGDDQVWSPIEVDEFVLPQPPGAEARVEPVRGPLRDSAAIFVDGLAASDKPGTLCSSRTLMTVEYTVDHIAEDAAGAMRKVPVGVDGTVPSVARVYDALLGGKDNFAVDRAIADRLMELTPGGANVPLYNRAVLGRGVRYMVSQGIDQFIDLGAGLPTVQNTHEVAQRENPQARVVYVDNDPMVLVHGRALLAENGNTTVITADFCEPDEVLNSGDLRALIDFDRPVGLLMVAVLHHLDDAQRPGELVARYRDAVPSGSFIFITHFIDGGEETAEIERVMLTDLGSGRFRSFDEVRGFFTGTELLEPGVVYNPLWRPDPSDVVPDPMSFAGKIIGAGLGRKP